METRRSDQFLEENVSIVNQPILTISAIALDFDFVTSNPSKSRADEIRVLLVKNKKSY